MSKPILQETTQSKIRALERQTKNVVIATDGSGGTLGDVTQAELDAAIAALETIRSASTMGVVIHGTNASAARPSGYPSVTWIGSVDPTNSSDTLDVWIDTTNLGASFQPLDADLTAIAALSTSSFGRSLLTTTDAADARADLLAEKNPTVLVSPAALPVSPTDGDRVYYFIGSGQGIIWEFIYSASGNVWYFIGGPPATVTVDTLETTTSTTYVALTTAGPSYTVPLAGDYDVRIEASIANGTAGSGGRMSFDVGGTGALDADGILHTVGGANADGLFSGSRRKTGLAASTALVSKYRALVSGTASFRFRRIMVTPIKVT